MKLQDNIVSEFDRFAEDYTRDMRKMVPYYDQLMTTFTACLDESFSPHTILDIGCGNGNVTHQLLTRFPNARYLLTDASPEMLRNCKERFPNTDISYHEVFFQDMMFDDSSFDLIAAGFSLHHLKADEKRDLFKKIFKWLRPNGLFLSSDLMISKNDADHPELLQSWESYARERGTTDEEWNWIMEHYDTYDHPHNHPSQLQWLRDAGFSDISKAWDQGHWICMKAIKN